VKKLLVVATIPVVSAIVVLSGVASVGASVGATAAGSSGGIPIIRAHPGGLSNGSLPTVSLNWSGYAATSATPFTYASTEFVQPSVTCNGTPHVYTSNWVGLDGFNDETVEQDGTAATCLKKSGYETPWYYAWIEMYPLPEVVAFGVTPGDVISASVRYDSGRFTLTITDVTTGRTKTQVASNSKAKRSSAEWIIERPAGCNHTLTKCFLFALADFGTTTMDDNVATVQGGTPTGLSSLRHTYPIFMVQNTSDGGFYTLDTVGSVHAASNSFSVKWLHTGKVTPITLGPKS